MSSRESQCYPHHSVIHLDLQPEIEAQLAAEAEAQGLAIDRYIETLVTARPVQLIKREESPAEAVAAIRELRKGNRLDGLSIKDLISEGRRLMASFVVDASATLPWCFEDEATAWSATHAKAVLALSKKHRLTA